MAPFIAEALALAAALALALSLALASAAAVTGLMKGTETDPQGRKLEKNGEVPEEILEVTGSWKLETPGRKVRLGSWVLGRGPLLGAPIRPRKLLCEVSTEARGTGDLPLKGLCDFYSF